MKKILCTLVVTLFVGVSASAQQPTFMKGDNVVGLGIGLVKTYYYGGGWVGYHGGRTSMPLFFASYERGIINNLFNEKSSLGVSGLFGFSSTKYSDVWKYSDIVVGARGVLHYALVDKLDTYGGLGFGVSFGSGKYDTGYSEINPKNSYNHFFPIFSLGARYYFTDAIAAFAEFGYGYTLISLGASFKF